MREDRDAEGAEGGGPSVPRYFCKVREPSKQVRGPAYSGFHVIRTLGFAHGDQQMELNQTLRDGRK